ncbi:MAG TPA: HYR domain-containing protein [Thermoanaerobaculia bacterium]|nr:HYR domain-containing protein [Thermoanaerobaculia bacterium]
MRFTAVVLAVLLSSAVLSSTAAAAEITSIEPAQLKTGPDPQFIQLHGQNLGTRIFFSGTGGEFQAEAHWQSDGGVAVWLPQQMLLEPGRYDVIASDGRTRSNAVALEIVQGPYHSLVVLVPDPVTRPAESKDGAHVRYEIWTYGGRDPNPTISCDHESGDLYPIGPTTVTCEARNSFGERATGYVFIFVYDTGLPVVLVPDRIVADAESDDGTRIEFEATASDVIDGELPVTCDPKSGSLFPIGVTWVQCSATDSAGNTGYEVFAIEIVDKEHTGPFVIHVPAAITAEAEGADGATVTFEVTADGTGDPRPAITCEPSSGSTFPIGTTSVTCVATDRLGNTATGTFTVTVSDTIAPLIANLTATPDVLEPPNHKFVPVELTVEANDVVDPSPRCAILDFSANQTLDDDVHITGELTLELRAERDGGRERIYTIRVQCADSFDNASIGNVIVRVPQGADDQEAPVTTPPPSGTSKRRAAGRG